VVAPAALLGLGAAFVLRRITGAREPAPVSAPDGAVRSS